MSRDQAPAAADGGARPIVWSIAGNDSGGGAGLSADQRAAAAFGVHLCPVVAAVTAQNSTGVVRVDALAPELLEAQLAALADDMPPAAVKTGLLGSADNVAVVARWIDKLRVRDPGMALVVDPVLGASTGAAFADDAVLRAYVDLLLPRATLVTPNASEAERLLAACGDGCSVAEPGAALPDDSAESAIRAVVRHLRATGDNVLADAPEGRESLVSPAAAATADGTARAAGERSDTPPQHGAESGMAAVARGLRAGGAKAVAITGGDNVTAPDRALDWIDTPHASGWLALPRVDTPHTHGTGCTFATSAACALARGFVAADALVLAKMATTQALRHGYAAGQGAGPVAARAGFAADPALLPLLSWSEDVAPDRGWAPHRPAADDTDIGIYAIVDSAERVRQVVAAGVGTVQLRIKAPDAPDAAWHEALRGAISESLAACRAAGATLVVNDHWRLAGELAAGDAGGLAVHLGQEDLLALGDEGRAELAATGLPLGVSSHSLWELARARALAPWYLACGPVWPTLTKAMPWLPQGLDNLAWWVHMAGVPVVAIGGILEPEQLAQAARSGAGGVCVVRGLGDDPALSLPLWQAALQAGRADASLPVPPLPHPSLPVAPS